MNSIKLNKVGFNVNLLVDGIQVEAQSRVRQVLTDR